jgi:hypothetical protein
MSYRDYLDRKGYQPLHIERTQKRGGDLVLRSWALPAEEAPGRKGQFAGTMRKAVGA